MTTFGARARDEFPYLAPEALTRPRLLTVVHARWTRPVTAVIAGAGFGKTTLLAQAVRENRLARLGVDVHLRLEPGDASALRLASRLLDELGEEPPRGGRVDDLADRLGDVVWGRAPSRLCFVLDDVHEVAVGSDGAALLTALVARLPGNADALVGARTFPEMGLARRAVAGEAVVLREGDLRFTPDEVKAFAESRGVAVEQLEPAHGWPALAELMSRATGVTVGEYVWEQVIGPVASDGRQRLAELAALGGADDELASAVAGSRVRLATALAEVPLVIRTGPDWWELHDVVAEPVLAREPADRVAAIRRQGGIHARRRGDTDRAVRLLVAAGAWDEVVATLRATFVQLGPPEDPALAASWAALLPPTVEAEPEVLLLRTVATTVADPERSFTLGEQAVAAFVARDDVDGEIAALARLIAIAYGLVETGRILPYIARIATLAETGHAWAVAFDAVCRGVTALLTGDWRTAGEILMPVAADPAADPTLGLAGYFYARAQVDGGRLHDAARTIERMPEAHRERVRDGVLGVQVAIAQGLGAGDEVLIDIREIAEARLDHRPLVARRNARCRLAIAAAMLGDLDVARDHMLELELVGGPVDATLDEELVAARATIAVVDGCEDEAAALLAEIPDRGVAFPPRDGLVLFYVLCPALRARYDAADLVGIHAQRRELAAAFVAARAGDLEPLGRYEWPRSAVVRWFAPAPWLVEAAVLSAAAGGDPGVELVAALGPSQRGVLRRLAASTVPAVARSGATLAAALPPAAPAPVVVRVLGPLEVDIGGVPSTAPEARRERVRSLLGLLVVRRSVRRIEAAGLLWPDLADDQALANLRVTLTHLLKLIEPRRDRNAPPYFVRAEPDRLTLRADPALSVDAWDFEAAAAEGEGLERSGAPSLALDALVRAVGFWRGDLLGDLGSQEWLDFDRIRLGTLFVRCARRAGELLAAHHELGHAELMAERVIAADRWGEAGYRLLASIHLERGDTSAARRILGHLDQVLSELDLTAGPETEALRRQVLERG